MNELFFEGIEKAATFRLDATTKTAIAADPKQIKGKAVAVTGNDTVGYGTSGDPIIGIVDPSVEPVSTNNNDLLVCVRRFRMFEEVPCAGTETAGKYAVVDGTGGVKAAKTDESTSTTVTSVNATAKTCTIWVL